MNETKNWYIGNEVLFDNASERRLDLQDFVHSHVTPQSHTYAELVAKIASCELLPGAIYIISDYQTIHYIPQTTEIYTGQIEQIRVIAKSTCKLSPIAFSDTYANDLIYYSIDNSGNGATSISKGTILQRIDLDNDINVSYDFRTVKFRRWADDDGNYVEVFENSNAYQDLTTFNSATNVMSVNIGSWNQNTDAQINYLSSITVDSKGLPNVVFNSTSVISANIATAYGVTVNGQYTNVFELKWGYLNKILGNAMSLNADTMYMVNILGNISAAYFTNVYNVDITGNCLNLGFQSVHDITLGEDCSGLDFYEVYDCTFGNDIQTMELNFINSCTFGNNCTQMHLFNTANYNFGNECKKVFKRAGKPHGSSEVDEPVTFGNNNVQIIIGEVFKAATIGNDNYNLVLDGGCTDVTIGNSCSHITIKSGADTIEIGDTCTDIRFNENCSNLTIGEGCSLIEFKSNCDNIILPDDSYLVTFERGCTDLMFNHVSLHPCNTTFDNLVTNKTFTTGDIFDCAFHTRVIKNSTGTYYENSLKSGTNTFTLIS